MQSGQALVGSYVHLAQDDVIYVRQLILAATLDTFEGSWHLLICCPQDCGNHIRTATLDKLGSVVVRDGQGDETFTNVVLCVQETQTRGAMTLTQRTCEYCDALKNATDSDADCSEVE